MNKPTLHLVGMPHVQCTLDYISDAYGMKLRNMAIMMSKKGYKVHVYASEDYDFEVTGDQVACITKKEQECYFGKNDHKKHFYNITWGVNEPHWVHFNNNVIGEINKRVKPGDIIGHFSGVCEQKITEAFPDCFGVEVGIGYTGVYSDYRVFESYSHMHFVNGTLHDDNGHFYSTVIPGYHDKNKFPFKSTNKAPEWLVEKLGDDLREGYFLYVGRLIPRKGYVIAQQVCEKLGKKLILAGQIDKDQEFSGYGEYIGTIDEKQRGELMSEAIATFTPSLYIEPFGNVHVESLLCGTPVISTNFGVYTETIQNGFNGQRCDDFQEFLNATQWAETLTVKDREKIREHAQSKWDLDVVAEQYDKYFQRLSRLRGKGWYETY